MLYKGCFSLAIRGNQSAETNYYFSTTTKPLMEEGVLLLSFGRERSLDVLQLLSLECRQWEGILEMKRRISKKHL